LEIAGLAEDLEGFVRHQAKRSRNPGMNINGVTQGRAMGVRILCTDCHNSDDNREFGGSGPNGPHGSRFTHILERR
jgi:hypothetical protein